MRMYLSFSLDLECGETDITPTNLRRIEELIEDNPLMALDCLGDIKGIVDRLYDDAHKALVAEWADIRQKAGVIDA